MKRVIIKTVSLIAALAFLPAFGSGERLFAPSVDPWPKWEAHDAGSSAAIDHGVWDGFLRRNVRDVPGANLIDYGAVSGADKAALDAYLGAMAGVAIGQFNRREQLAYWINVYNALTVKVVLDHYPVASIRDVDISPGLLSSGPWDAEVITVAGQALTLNDIEHRILRPIWRDPLIHYGVNCASIGCPDLRPSAYTGANVEATLEAAARSYVNDPRGVRVSGGKVIVSRIYDWFIEDFGGREAGVIAHLKTYANRDLARALEDGLSDTDYDWSLNNVR